MGRTLLALVYGVAIVAVTACGGPKNGDDTGDAGDSFERIEVTPATQTLTVALGGTATQDYVVFGVRGSERTEITSTCALGIPADHGTTAGATVTVGARGGKFAVTATCDGQIGEAQLIVNLTGTVIGPGAPANSAEIFETATAGADPARTPAIEYPIDGAVSPRNIPSIEVQWTVAGNDLYHVIMASTFATIHAYSVTPEALLTATDWESLVGSVAGENLAITVEGLAQASPGTKFTSTPVTLTVTHDRIDQTAIYYWASSQGNIMSQTFGDPTEPEVVKGECTSCHSVSRAGTRIGYSRCVGGNCGEQFLGFLKYDSNTDTWVETVNANDKATRGSYTTFAPIGNPFPDDSKALAMATLQNGTLALFDPDTGAAVPSNLAIANGTGSALMPDWSPDGTRVVYAKAPGANLSVDLTEGRIATMSYAFTNGEHVFGEPQLLVPDPITLPNGTYNNFFFPSYSSDNSLVVFNAARAGWRNFTDARTSGQRLMLADAAGAWVTDLTALNGGNVDLDITWAHWAPAASSDYHWIVFSSERDYGHRATAATSPASCKANGVTQCKQIWLGAVSKAKVALGGTIDPSAPPMWLPGQSPTANNISPYWTRPASIEKSARPGK